MGSIRTAYTLFRGYQQARSVMRSLGLIDSPVPGRSTAAQVLTGAGLVGGGMLLGAGLALLFTPMTGSELRGFIQSRLTDLVAGVGDRAGAWAGGDNGRSTWEAE